MGAESLETSEIPSELPGYLFLCLVWLPAALTHPCIPWRWFLHHNGCLGILCMPCPRSRMVWKFLTTAGAWEKPVTGCVQALAVVLPGTTCSLLSQNTEMCRVVQRPDMALGMGAGKGHGSCASPSANVGWGL